MTPRAQPFIGATIMMGASADRLGRYGVGYWSKRREAAQISNNVSGLGAERTQSETYRTLACTKGITPITSNPATRNPIPMYMIGSIMKTC
jgi:hypothetical protein